MVDNINFIDETETPYEEESGQFDIMEYVRILLARWKFIALWGFVAAVLGAVVAFSIPNEYAVYSSLAPESSKTSPSGGMSSLASLAGINLSGLSSSDAVNPLFYPGVVHSNPFTVDLLSMPISFVDKKGETVHTDLYEYMKEYTKAPWWNKILALPRASINLVKKLMAGNKVEGTQEGAASVLNPAAFTYEQYQVAFALKKRIVLDVDKKTSAISLGVTMQNPQIAVDVCNKVLDLLKTYMIKYRTGKAQDDLAYYQKLYDEAKESYYSAQHQYARYVDSHQGLSRESVRVEQERLQSEMQLKYSLYNSCAQQLQAAKANVQKETPVFAVVNPASRPVLPFKPSKSKIFLAFAFLGVCASAAWVLWGDYVIGLFKKKEEEPVVAE